MNKVNSMISRMPLSQLGCNILISCEGEELYINGIEGKVSEVPIKGIVATVYISTEHLIGILTGEENAISLFTSGEIKVEGDMSVAFKLKQIFG